MTKIIHLSAIDLLAWDVKNIISNITLIFGHWGQLNFKYNFAEKKMQENFTTPLKPLLYPPAVYRPSSTKNVMR